MAWSSRHHDRPHALVSFDAPISRNLLEREGARSVGRCPVADGRWRAHCLPGRGLAGTGAPAGARHGDRPRPRPMTPLQWRPSHTVPLGLALRYLRRCAGRLSAGHAFRSGLPAPSPVLGLAIRLGARRILAIGAGQPQGAGRVSIRTDANRAAGTVAGHAMANGFHDTLLADVQQVQQVSQSLNSLVCRLRSLWASPTPGCSRTHGGRF